MKAPDSRFVERYGPWVVVTGASDGIGRAFARQLASQGMNLVLVARRELELEKLSTEIERLHGNKCRVIAADLSELSAVQRCLDATADIDVGLLIASAGFGTSGPLADASMASECQMIDVNCKAPLVMTMHYAQRLKARGRGGIVLMSSLLGFFGVPRAAHYAATKAYVQSLAEGLRGELAPFGVDVLASAPGPIASGFDARANMRSGMSQTPEVVARVSLAALGRRTTVRPGWLAKLLGWSLSTVPRWGRVLIITQIMKGMTAHHRPAAAR